MARKSNDAITMTREHLVEKLRVAAFEKELFKLQKQNLALEAENATLKARVRALEEVKPENAIRTMTDEELTTAIEENVKALGYVKPLG